MAVEIDPIYPHGTNSTMFTQCCGTAICDDEANCPSCKKPVIGHDMSPSERRRIRWRSATRYWKRKK